MQVKKFEAPTLQEALENIKRELGPEAIILQTKKHKRGFGLMSKSSVEVTAAVSDRSIQKKDFADKRIPAESREAMQKAPAGRQADIYDKYMDRAVERSKDKVEIRKSANGGAIAAGAQVPVTSRAATQKKLTATRYIDIDEAPARPAPAPKPTQA
jgi:flagellar biosynthesis protein FlhF